ncbi:MAG: hypothetical protein AB7S38_37250 [Vulcanimicrobiota bacterium]
MPELPPRVKYARPTAEAEQAELERLRRLLSGEVEPEEIGVLGPFLTVELVDGLPGDLIPVSFVVPLGNGVITARGFSSRRPEQLTSLLALISKRLGEFSVRRPTAVEVDLLWSMVPYDLEGPLFVLEGSDHRLLWNSANGLLFLEDMADIGETLDDGFKALSSLPDSQFEPSPQADFVSGKLPEIVAEAEQEDETQILLVTDQESLGKRVKVDPLADYIKTLLGLVEKVEHPDVIRVQVDFDAQAGPLVRVGSRTPLAAPQQLIDQLAAVTPPPTTGPVCFVLLVK